MVTFEVGYQNIFGEKISHNLIEKGAEVLVTQDNKQVSMKQRCRFKRNKLKQWVRSVLVCLPHLSAMQSYPQEVFEITH